MIFFTADHHFSHANIIKYCNHLFAKPEEMNQEMIKRWNETVSKDDTVYYLVLTNCSTVAFISDSLRFSISS